jgi:hypothetical protein
MPRPHPFHYTNFENSSSTSSSSSSVTRVDLAPPAGTHVVNDKILEKSAIHRYNIGNQVVSPLVSVADIKDFLRLLGAFNKLEQDVRKQWDLGVFPKEVTGADAAWELYLHRAVYRFELWSKKVVTDVKPPGTGFASNELPPLDVVLIWHTYVLVSKL